MSAVAPGDVLKGRYEVLDVAGEGAMGVVHRVRDRLDGSIRAVKELVVDGLSDAELEEAWALFEREARLLHGLGHPAFPHVTDYFVDDGHPFQVMDFIEGRTLEDVVENDGPLPEWRVLQVALRLASCLGFLHEHPMGPIVYRDLKPSNIILTPDAGAGGVAGEPRPWDVRLVDFGIARVYKPHRDHDTQPLGTPGYAAPEQYTGRQTTPASDVYSLAATLRYALTGVDPIPGVAPAPPPAGAAPCSDGLRRLLAMCQRTNAADRPRTGTEVCEMVGHLMDLAAGRVPGTLLSARPDAGTMWRWVGAMYRVRVPRVGIGVSLGVLACLLFLLVFIVPNMTRNHCGGQTTACKSNLKNIATALEMYSTDNSGRFPTSLDKLTPSYFKTIPTCPSVGSNTYTTGYISADHPDAYTVVCTGNNHAGVGLSPCFPQYNSTQGLTER